MLESRVIRELCRNGENALKALKSDTATNKSSEQKHRG